MIVELYHNYDIYVIHINIIGAVYHNMLMAFHSNSIIERNYSIVNLIDQDRNSYRTPVFLILVLDQ